MAGKGQITCKRASSWKVIGDGRRREHPNQHFVLLIKCTLRNTTVRTRSTTHYII